MVMAFEMRFYERQIKLNRIFFSFFSLHIIDMESFMHPSEFLPRNKRMTNTLVNHDETSTFFWQNRAQYTLRNHLAKEHNENIAKNIIFFLGDGMSIPTLAAARIYLGQMQGYNGEEGRLSFETFPYIGLAKVRAYVVHSHFYPQ